MKQKYRMFCLICAALVVAFMAASCSEKEEDIASPSITIIRPIENDTIRLTNNFITIETVAQDHVGINDMEMNVIDNSGTVLFSYDKDEIETTAYSCMEQFYPEGITKVTQMKLTVTFANEYKNWNSKSINFYVKP
ncbi:MAG: hypothetical protein ACOYMF_11405 [Bacteroidales bacterium]